MWKIGIFIAVLAVIATILTIYKPSVNSKFLQRSQIQTKISSPTSPPSSPISAQNSSPKTQIIATGLKVPWAIAFLPDGEILITERGGTVRMIDKDGKLLSEPSATIIVKQTGESGLHGIAIHPDFNNNKFVYLYYTYAGSDNQTLNRVSRFVLSASSLIDEKIIVDKIPGAVFHDGGRIKFGPDGYLYITTGDATNPSLSQDKASLAGKILRVTVEGKSAPGNPFSTQVYSYGHRNPQGISWDDKGNLWSTEHGQSAQDELNKIQIGRNYGWPTIRGSERKDSLETPIVHSDSQTWAPAGIAYYPGGVFFGGLRSQTLFQVNLETLEIKEHFKGEFGRIREVVLGPDQMIYITTSNKDGRGNPSPDDDKIIKVNPEKL